MEASLSIITPVIRWKTLKRMLTQLVPQLTSKDEALIVGDGPQPECRKVVEEFRCPYLKYWDGKETRKWGNHQRNEAIARATGTHLVFIDDDDQLNPWGLKVIREVASTYHDRPIMFRVRHPKGKLLGVLHRIERTNVSGQMFVPPNRKDRLDCWGASACADFGFIRRTVDKYPDRDNGIVWREEMPIIPGRQGV